MKVEMRAEYACGHSPRSIVNQTINPANLREELARIVQPDADGEVKFTCDCGRGAAYVEIWIDGKLRSRAPASAFIGKGRVSRVQRDAK